MRKVGTVVRGIRTPIIKANDILVCEIHNREKTKKLFSQYNVYTLCDVMNKRRKNIGYNPTYGLLGSNKATEEKLKLFPRNGNSLVNSIQKELKKITGKNIEVMVYGDSCIPSIYKRFKRNNAFTRYYTKTNSRFK